MYIISLELKNCGHNFLMFGIKDTFLNNENQILNWISCSETLFKGNLIHSNIFFHIFDSNWT